MCLHAKYRLPRIALKDITVYKILVYENENFSGPYYVDYSFKYGVNVPEGKNLIFRHYVLTAQCSLIFLRVINA